MPAIYVYVDLCTCVNKKKIRDTAMDLIFKLAQLNLYNNDIFLIYLANVCI